MAPRAQVRVRRQCQGASLYGQGCRHTCFITVYSTQLVCASLFVLIIIANGIHMP